LETLLNAMRKIESSRKEIWSHRDRGKRKSNTVLQGERETGGNVVAEKPGRKKEMAPRENKNRKLSFSSMGTPISKGGMWIKGAEK